MNIRKPSLILAAALTIGITAGCYKDNKEDMYPSGTTTCDTTGITYTADIQALVNTSCALSGCHDAATASGSYALNSYANVKVIADNGRFLATITSGTMPKNASKLDDCSISKVRSWIRDGAPEN